MNAELKDLCRGNICRLPEVTRADSGGNKIAQRGKIYPGPPVREGEARGIKNRMKNDDIN